MVNDRQQGKICQNKKQYLKTIKLKAKHAITGYDNGQNPEVPSKFTNSVFPQQILNYNTLYLKYLDVVDFQTQRKRFLYIKKVSINCDIPSCLERNCIGQNNKLD